MFIYSRRIYIIDIVLFATIIIISKISISYIVDCISSQLNDLLNTFSTGDLEILVIL